MSETSIDEIRRGFESWGEDSCRDAIEILLARVAKLEAALTACKRYAENHDDEWVPFTVDEALKDTP